MSKVLNRKKLFWFQLIKPLLLAISWISSKKSLSEKRVGRSLDRVCLWHTYRLGDVVMLSDVCAAIQETYPSTQITLVVNGSGLSILKSSFPQFDFVVINTPWVNGYSFNNFKSVISGIRVLRGKTISTALEFQGDGRNCFLASLIDADYLVSFGNGGGERFCSEVLPSYFSEHLLDANRRLVKSCFPLARFRRPWLMNPCRVDRLNTRVSRRCGVSLGASDVVKMVSAERFYQALRTSMVDSGVQEVVIFSTRFQGSQEERDLSALVRTQLKTQCVIAHLGLEDVMSEMSGLCLFVGVDSGLAHMASALAVPTDIIFTNATMPEIHTPGFWGVGVYRAENL